MDSHPSNRQVSAVGTSKYKFKLPTLLILLQMVSVDGSNGQRGALVHLPDASPEAITEETPSANVTPTQSHGRASGKARPRS